MHGVCKANGKCFSLYQITATIKRSIHMSKSTHGGARKGAGAKKKEPTKTIAFRVKLDKAEMLTVKIKALIKRFG